MSELSKKYSDIMTEIENKITNEEDLKFVKNKISELSIIFIDVIDRMSEVVEERITNLEQSQRNVENKITKIQSSMDSIEQDIYNDDSEIEITCPYCNSDFLAEFNEEAENEIECPECHNVIELDLNADYDEDNGFYTDCHGGCCGSCGGCSHKKDNEDDI